MMPKLIINQLTARKVQTITKPGLYADGLRLYLQVAKGGSKSWVFRYVLRGRLSNMGLGSTATVSLQEARKRANIASLKILDGVNPLDERRAQRAIQRVEKKTKPFEQCAKEFIIAYQFSWKGPREVIRWQQTLEDYAFPIIGKMSVSDITPDDIIRVLKPIWYSKTRTADQLRGRMERIFNWTVAHGLSNGDNPATRERLEHMLPAKTKIAPTVNRPALPWVEVGAFMRSLENDNSIQCRALEFLILTCVRSEEVLDARWSEIELDNRIWVIPAERMKQKKEHRVPLASAAMKLLKNLPRVTRNPYVFPGRASGGRLSPTAMQLKTKKLNNTITAHGFRSTFSQWAADRTNYQWEVREMVLAHSVGSNVERIYQRSDLFEKRRALMEEWGEFVTRPPAEVVSLRP